MDTVLEREIMRGVHLTAVRAERFKTGCLSMTLLAPHMKKTAAMNAVLPYVLRRGTARLPDMESIAAALDDMYGVRIEPAIRKKGEVAAVGFCADFPDRAFLPGMTDTLGQTAQLMGELLLSPATRGGRLRADYVESERRNLTDDINAEINDKRSYASLRLTEAMFRGESYGVPKLGTLADAGRISVATLTRHYKELIVGAPIEIFYCGAEDPERVAAIAREVLSPLPRAAEIVMPVTHDAARLPAGPAKRIVERMDVTQGRLIMGFRLGEIMEEPDFAALAVFNAAFGGVTGKLFTHVRERLGLCYYAQSVVDRYKGALFVSAGIDHYNAGRAEEEILRQLELLAAGEMEDWELDGARRATVSAIYSALDEPMGLEGMYLDRAAAGMAERPEELAARASMVSREEIARIAGAAKLACVYFLTAEDEDA